LLARALVRCISRVVAAFSSISRPRESAPKWGSGAGRGAELHGSRTSGFHKAARSASLRHPCVITSSHNPPLRATLISSSRTPR
jgi:hypothetical protein